MPEDTIKFYPFIARILLLLDGLPLVTFRAAIVAARAEDITSYRMIHRFVMEYKGRSESCSENDDYMAMCHFKIYEYLQSKLHKARWYENRSLQPVTEVEINLREATIRTLQM
jgi:regulator of sigma D